MKMEHCFLLISDGIKHCISVCKASINMWAIYRDNWAKNNPNNAFPYNVYNGKESS